MALLMLGNIGDLLLIEPCLRYLHSCGVTIDLFCTAETAMVWEGDKRIRAIFPVRASNAKYEAEQRSTRIGFLRRSYDWLFDFRPTGRSLKISMRLLARKRITWSASGAKGLLYKVLHSMTMPFPHGIRRDRICLKLLGIEGTAADQWLPARMDVSPERVHAFEEQHKLRKGAGQQRLLIQPTARWKRKLWPASSWRELIERLRKFRPSEICLVSGPVQEEIDLVQQIAEGLVPRDHLFAGNLAWNELQSLIASSDLFVGLDSAPYHMAAMLDRPLVVLFGPTNEQEWGPVLPHQILVKAPSTGEIPAMNNIKVADVEAAVKSLFVKL
ncbi:MAG: glycosyltransferase family 9 protein [Verrucomicrobiota bacterium]|nr:glycosyltransferase family 9 protein [Verrucomicrobiota bacterium]